MHINLFQKDMSICRNLLSKSLLCTDQILNDFQELLLKNGLKNDLEIIWNNYIHLKLSFRNLEINSESNHFWWVYITGYLIVK